MKFNITIFIFLLAFSSLNVIAQNDVMQKIVKLYTEAKDIVQQQKNEDIPIDCFTYILNQNLPAIGQQTIKYDMYFTLDNNEDNGDEPTYLQTLKLVEKSYNIAAGKFYEEFLFDKGELVFYYGKEIYINCNEIRMYFDNKSLIKMKVTTFDADSCKTILNQETFTNKNVPSEYKDEITKQMAEANFIQNLFEASKTYR